MCKIISLADRPKTFEPTMSEQGRRRRAELLAQIPTFATLPEPVAS